MSPWSVRGATAERRLSSPTHKARRFFSFGRRRSTARPRNTATNRRGRWLGYAAILAFVAMLAGLAAPVAAQTRPNVELKLSSDSMSEDGGFVTVTATLSNWWLLSDITMEVSVAAVSPAVAGDFTLSTNRTLTVAAGQTTSTGTVTITANDNDVDAPDKEVTVSGRATNTQGVTDPANQTLTIIDDETPAVTLVLDPDSIGENGESSTVTATLSGLSSEEVTVTVSAAAVSPAVAGDFTLAGTILTIAAGETASTGTVTITANDNDVDAPDKKVTVSATVTGGNGVAAPSAVTLTLTDDEPARSLGISDAVAEEGGTARFTVTLSGAVASDVTVDWATENGTATAPEDYAELSGTLTFRLGDVLQQTLTVATVRDAVAEGEETFSVRLSNVRSSLGVTADSSSPATGTIADDTEAALQARLGRVIATVLPEDTRARVANTLDAVTGRNEASAKKISFDRHSSLTDFTQRSA